MTAARMHSLFNALTSGSAFRQYRLLEQIGVGGEGVVWSALDQKQNQIHAIKFTDLPDAGNFAAEEVVEKQQLQRLVKLQHAHVLPILEYGFEAQLRFTVSPYLPGGTLLQKIKMAPPSIDEIIRYATEIAAALDYLHSQGIIHRDLKSQNILLDLRDTCYLTDFGLARLMTTSTLAFHTGHGTPPYASPEQIQSRALTPKSDLYSFGILLYEMFTGQLPWNGKKQLSMEQLNSDQELPDPREFNDNLPFVLADLLRRVTAADPDLRPASAAEIIKVLRRVFNMSVEMPPIRNHGDGWTVLNEDVEQLLQRAFVQWNSTDGTFNLGLSKFALVDSRRGQINLNMYNQFLLSQALTYAYNDDQWWLAVRDPGERLAIAAKLFRKHNEALTGRIITHMTTDASIAALPKGLPESMTASLLETGIKTDNAFLRQQIFEGVRKLTQPRAAWRGRSPLNVDQANRLGELALEDSEFGDTAAELVGHLRSNQAVKVVLNHPDDPRKIDALLLVQKVAGSLPGFVPGNVRMRLSNELIVQRLVQAPVSLAGAYVMALLGATLGVALQVYLTYNLPNFMDTARISTSLIQGLIIGSIFGLGLFITRVVVERFPASPALTRVLVATGLGTVGLNIALLIFHVLFLNTPPHGLLITAACGLIAFTFAVGSLLRSRPIRIVLAMIATFAAIVGTWWIHTNFSDSLLQLTPVFPYDFTWPTLRVVWTALVVALPIGVLGNMVNLSIVEE